MSSQSDDSGAYDLAPDPSEEPPKRRPPAGASATAPAGARPQAKAGAKGAAGPKMTRPGPAAPRPAARPAGAAPAKRRAPTAMEAAAAMSGGRGLNRNKPDHDRTAAIDAVKKAGLLLGVIVLLAAIVVTIRLTTGGGTAPALGDDKEARELIRDMNYEEIRGWLEGGRQDRTLVGMMPRQSKARAEEWYGMGAKQVLAGGTMQSTRVVIELPDDPEARKRLIEEANTWLPLGEPPVTDVGQQYVILHMRL